VDKSLISLFKAVLFGIATVVVIPRELYKKYLLYGFVFGAIGDIITVLLMSLLGLIKYSQMGPFSIYGFFSFWTPIAWMFAFMLFFYFLPRRRLFLYPYVVGFALFGYMLGLVLEGFGVFQYIGFWRYVAPFFFTLWFSGAAWVFFRLEGVKVK